MRQLDRSAKAPLFQQIITHVIDAIQAGELNPGDKLPRNDSSPQTMVSTAPPSTMR